MVIPKAFTFAVLGFLQTSSTLAHLLSADVHSDQNCQGNVVTVYTDVSQNYCFNTGGNSFGNAYGDQSVGPCLNWGVRTWSGADCRGSSAYYYRPYNTCTNVPFASIQLTCL
jgi:hypothetical protein